MFRPALLVTLAFASVALAQTYTATYTPENAPKISEQGQSGTNQCGTGSSPDSMCQNVYVNSLDDWCVFAPPTPGPGSAIGNTERIEVAWCVQAGHGTRVIPDGAIQGAHFVQTPDYVQVTGVGDLTKLNIPDGDAGGELDPHGADGKGNPIGGLVFSNAFGKMSQMHEWTNFISYNEFCIRACKDGPNAARMCEHIYDVMGCYWNMPGDYSPGSFDSCKGESGEPMGVYGTSTFRQGQPSTPDPHPAPPKSQCNKVNTIGNGQHITTPSSPASTTSASTKPTTSASSQASSGAGSSSSVPTSTAVSSSSSASSSATAVPTTLSSTGRLTTTNTARTSAPVAPLGSTAGSSAAGSSSSTTPTDTPNGATAAFAGRGFELLIAGAAVIVGAVVA